MENQLPSLEQGSLYVSKSKFKLGVAFFILILQCIVIFWIAYSLSLEQVSGGGVGGFFVIVSALLLYPILGVIGVVRSIHMLKSKEQPQYYKVVALILLITSLGLVTVFPAFALTFVLRDSLTPLAKIHHAADIQQVDKQRIQNGEKFYKVLAEEFKNPQKLKDIDENGFLVLESGKKIKLSDIEYHEGLTSSFKDFVRAQLIGSEVQVILPSYQDVDFQSYLSANYYFYNTHQEIPPLDGVVLSKGVSLAKIYNNPTPDNYYESNHFVITLNDRNGKFLFHSGVVTEPTGQQRIEGNFDVSLPAEKYSENNFSCDPKGIVERVTVDIGSIGSPYYIKQFKPVKPGLCVLTNGDFSVFIKVIPLQ